MAGDEIDEWVRSRLYGNPKYGSLDARFQKAAKMFELNVRAANVIKRGIPNLEAFLKMDESEILAIKDCGKKTTAEIVEYRNRFLRDPVLLRKFKDYMEASQVFDEFEAANAELVSEYTTLKKARWDAYSSFNWRSRRWEALMTVREGQEKITQGEVE